MGTGASHRICCSLGNWLLVSLPIFLQRKIHSGRGFRGEEEGRKEMGLLTSRNLVPWLPELLEVHARQN